MRQRSCKSASLSSLFHPPSRANFKEVKKSFCIGGEKDSIESLTRDGPSSVGTTRPKITAEARGNSGQSIHSLFGLSGFSKRPWGAPRWAVGPRTPPVRTGLRPRSPVGPRRPACLPASGRRQAFVGRRGAMGREIAERYHRVRKTRLGRTAAIVGANAAIRSGRGRANVQGRRVDRCLGTCVHRLDCTSERWNRMER